MKYATVGTSWITEAFILGAESTHMQLGAVYSRDIGRAESFGAKFGCSIVFDDIRKMACWEGIDAVYIASPNSMHYSQSKLFLEKGKHVLCEKPVTVTAAEYEELCALADQKGLIYLEALMFMYHPQKDAFARALKQIGKITTARLDFSQLSSKYQLLEKGETPNVFNPALGGGCLMDMGVYCVYPAIDWFGIPKEIFSRALKVHTGSDGCVSSVFIYPDKQVQISLSKTAQSAIGCEILGDQGTMTIDFIVEMKEVWIIKKNGQKEQVCRNYSRTELMASEAEHFHQYIQDGQMRQKEYLQLRRQTLQLRRILERMKKDAGI